MFSVCEWYTRDDNVRKIASESFASNISPATMPVRGECCMVYWGGGGHMYSHVKKLYELSFSPVYSETTVRNGYMDRTYIERNS